jgi:lipoprotein NlpI
LEIGDIEKAKKQFMTILKTNQDHLNSRKGLAFCYYLEEKYDLASNQMNKASEAFRSNSVYEALFNYYALLGSGKTSESKSYLTKYNDFFSGSEWSKCILAYHLGVTSENDLLEKSQNEKNLCQAYFYIGCRYWHTGAPKKAYQWFNKASAIESDDFEYYCAKVRLTQLSALYGLAKK